MQAGNLCAKIERQQTKVLGGVTTASLFHPCAEREFEARGEVVRALPEASDLLAEIERNDAQVCGGETLAPALEVRAQPFGQSSSHFVGALALLPQQVEWTAKAA